MVKLNLTVNGKPAVVSADDPRMPLLYAPRNDIGLHGPRLRLRIGPMRRMHGAR
jgi:nicotinate dehydrogenase subunit A